MDNNKSKTFIIIILVILIGAVGFLTYEKFSNESRILKYQNEITDLKKQIRDIQRKNINNISDISIDDLFGTYTWEKHYTNSAGTKLDLKIKLVLNDDGSAAYEASSGLESEKTNGTFVYENGKIIYNRLQNNDGTKYEGKITETFKVIDNTTLQNKYYDQITVLTKVE